MRQLQQDFARAAAKTEKLQNNLPRIIGVEAVRIVRQNFDLQGYDTGYGIKPWARRADVTNWAYDYNRSPNASRLRYNRKGERLSSKAVFVTTSGRVSHANNPLKGSVVNGSNPILLQTRTLYKGIQYFLNGKSVTIGVDPTLIVYAKKMNEGGPGKWGKYASTNTPPRQFMPKPNEPPNKKVLDAVDKKVKFEQYEAMKDFRK